MEEEVRTTSCPLYLPRSVASSHTACVGIRNNNNDSFVQGVSTDEKLLLGKMHYNNEEYTKARQLFELSCSVCVPAKYQLAVMMYDGLGGESYPVQGLDFLLLL